MWQENKTPQAITPQLLLLFLFFNDKRAKHTLQKIFSDLTISHCCFAFFGAYLFSTWTLSLYLSFSLTHSLRTFAVG